MKRTFSRHSVTGFKIGSGQKVAVETLLMKLALAETVIREMGSYIDSVEGNSGVCPDGLEAPDCWAMSGLSQNLFEIGHALKCGCFGHRLAHMF